MTDRPLIWITGASSGIGRALAVEYLGAGWRVVGSARNAAGIPEGAVALPLDVTDRQAVAVVVAGIRERHGAIDLAVLNAGTHVPTPGDRLDAEVFRTLFDLNVMGTVHGLEAVLPGMIERGRGQIAIVSSVAGWSGLPGAGAYGASKAALNTLAESLRLDLAHRGVDIRLVCPGFVRTPLTDRNDFPMPFRIEATEAARRIRLGLASRHRFEISFPRRFTLPMKALRLLPRRAYFGLVSRLTGVGQAT